MKYLQHGPLSVAGHKAPEKCGGYWPQKIGRNKGQCVNCGEREGHPNHAVFEVGADLATGPDATALLDDTGKYRCSVCREPSKPMYVRNGWCHCPKCVVDDRKCDFCGKPGSEFFYVDGKKACLLGCKGPQA